jgi:hypothetical protein
VQLTLGGLMFDTGFRLPNTGQSFAFHATALLAIVLALRILCFWPWEPLQPSQRNAASKRRRAYSGRCGPCAAVLQWLSEKWRDNFAVDAKHYYLR